MKLAYVFPGQGAQYVGMGKELYANHQFVRDLFEEADEALGFSLSQLILDGPEEDLRLTYHTQPALLTVSISALRVFQHATPAATPSVVAGHSLGEYTALVAASALSFRDAIKLVHHRGKLMDQAVPAGMGAMSAVMGMDENMLSAVCREASLGEDIVEIANLNCPGQIVISGTADAVERASALAREAGARRIIPLVVSGPFHCALMQPAADELHRALEETPFDDAMVPVIANVDAKPYVRPSEARQALTQQLFKSVRWEDDVRAMLSLGVDHFIEFGPGTVLSGLIKKVERRILTSHVEDEASLAETVASLGSE